MQRCELITPRYRIPVVILGDGERCLVCVNAAQQTMNAWGSSRGVRRTSELRGGSVKAQSAFMARECFALSLDRVYRVYSSGGEMVFIKVGGQGGFGRGVAVQFGLLGALVYGWLEKRAKARLATEVASMDRRDLRGLLAKDKANFSTRVAEVVSSAIEPPSGFHGPHVGKWQWQASDGTTHQFQFEDVEEMRTAIETLPALLGGIQRVNVRWDGTKNKYVKLE